MRNKPIVTVVCIGVYIAMLIFTIAASPTTDKYDIFYDLLSIILAIAAVAIAILGYGLYQFILHSAEKKQKEFLRYTNSIVYLNVGYSIWLSYKSNKNPEQLKHAIFITDAAYLNAQKLDIQEKRYELLNCEILNNLSYYLAERKKEGDIELAKQYAEFFMQRRQNHPTFSLNWQKTYEFIIQKQDD